MHLIQDLLSAAISSRGRKRSASQLHRFHLSSSYFVLLLFAAVAALALLSASPADAQRTRNNATTIRPAPTVLTNPGVVTRPRRTRTQSLTLPVPTAAPKRHPIKFLSPMVGEVCVYVGGFSSVIAATMGPHPFLPMQMSRLALLFEAAECGEDSGVLPGARGFGTHFPVSAFTGLHVEFAKTPTTVDFYRGGIVANVVCGIAITALLFVFGVILNCLKPELAKDEDGGIVWQAVTAAMFPSSMVVIQSLLLEGTVFMIFATFFQTTEYAIDIPITVSMSIVILGILGGALRSVRNILFRERIVKGYSTTVDVQQREQCLGQVVRSSFAAFFFYGREAWHGGRSRTTPTNVYGNREGAKLPPNARRIALFYRALRPPKAAAITIDDIGQLFIGHYFFFEALVTAIMAIFHAVVPLNCGVGLWGMFGVALVALIVSVRCRPHLVPASQIVADLLQLLTVAGMLAMSVGVSLSGGTWKNSVLHNNTTENVGNLNVTLAALRKTSDIAGLSGVAVTLVIAVLSLFASIAFWFAGGKMIPDSGELRALYLSTSNPVSPSNHGNDRSASAGNTPNSRRTPGSNERSMPLLLQGANTPNRRLTGPAVNNNKKNIAARGGGGGGGHGVGGGRPVGIPLSGGLEPLSAATIQRVVGDWPAPERHHHHHHDHQPVSDGHATIISIDDSPIRGELQHPASGNNHYNSNNNNNNKSSGSGDRVLSQQQHVVKSATFSASGMTAGAAAAAAVSSVPEDRTSMASLNLSDDESDINLDDDSSDDERKNKISSSINNINVNNNNNIEQDADNKAGAGGSNNARRRAATVSSNPLLAGQAGVAFVSAKDLQKIVRQVQQAKDAEDEAAENAAAAAAANSASSPVGVTPPSRGSAVGHNNPFMAHANSSSSSNSSPPKSGQRTSSVTARQQQQPTTTATTITTTTTGVRSQSGATSGSSNNNQKKPLAREFSSDNSVSQRHKNFQFGGAFVSPTASRSNSYNPPINAQPVPTSMGSDGWRPTQRSGSKQLEMDGLSLDEGNNFFGSPIASRVTSFHQPRYQSSNNNNNNNSTDDFYYDAAAAAAGAGSGTNKSNDSPPPPPPPPGMKNYDSGSSADGSPTNAQSATPPPNVFGNVAHPPLPQQQQQQQQPLHRKPVVVATASKNPQQRPSSSSTSAAAAAAAVPVAKRTVQQRREDLARSDSLMSNYVPPAEGEEEI